MPKDVSYRTRYPVVHSVVWYSPKLYHGGPGSFHLQLYYVQHVTTSSLLCLQDGCCISGHCISYQKGEKMKCLVNDFYEAPLGDLCFCLID